jgi:hypothetical protein
MNKLEYYDRQKEPWEESELNQIREEYVDMEMTISKIADIHRRTPGSISFKLKKLGVIENTTLARGYTEYKNSELYNEIVNKNKTIDTVKQKKSTEKKPANKTDSFLKLEIEISDLKREIIHLRNSMGEMTQLLKTLCNSDVQVASKNNKRGNLVNQKIIQ